MFYLTPPRHISTLPNSDLGPRLGLVRSSLNNRHSATTAPCPKSANTGSRVASSFGDNCPAKQKWSEVSIPMRISHLPGLCVAAAWSYLIREVLEPSRLFRPTTHSLNIVSVGICQIGGVIIRILVRAQARHAAFLAACGRRRRRRTGQTDPARGLESHMHRRYRRFGANGSRNARRSRQSRQFILAGVESSCDILASNKACPRRSLTARRSQSSGPRRSAKRPRGSSWKCKKAFPCQ
jgi:hypothetical protein